MTKGTATFTGGRNFDGAPLLTAHAARFQDGVLTALISEREIAPDETVIDLGGDILAPGYVDLQVNGGGGVMFNDAPSVDNLTVIAKAHRSLGSVSLLPTLITDHAENTTAAIAAVRHALRDNVAGIAGLHLEGPHLSVARKGAHDAALIRPMDDADLHRLLRAKDDIPVLKITVAPENVTRDQVRQLSRAGILVSLGHSDASFDTCCAYAEAGATCVTHLFNAMSQLGNRAPGLVGAALNSGALSAGLIADTLHVHPATMRAAWAAKVGPGRIFLVTDAMAVAGSDQTEFTLGGRRILRRDGTLTLPDGTLAGADLDLTRAIDVLVNTVGVALADALCAATSVPAALIGMPTGLRVGHTQRADLNRISADLKTLTAL